MFAGANVDKRIVRQRFDRHAKEYDRYAEVQRVMADELVERMCQTIRPPLSEGTPQGNPPNTESLIYDIDLDKMTASIDEVSCAVRILDIGCGTGMLSERLARAFPGAELTLVDLSSRMLERASTKLTHAGVSPANIHLITADAEAWLESACGQKGTGRPTFNIIASSAAFQWFNFPADTTHRLLQLLAPGGLLAFATFFPGTVRELHDAFRQAEALLGFPTQPHGQSYPNKEDWMTWLLEHGGDGPAIRWETSSYRYTFPDVRTALAQVRRVGAGNAVLAHNDARTMGDGQRKGTTSRELIHAMLQAYQATFQQDDGRVPLTYEVAYCLTQRGCIPSISGIEGSDRRCRRYK
ncbi:malonyl-acyl carrier protein O-methyltransferase BioC [Paenibacillus sp. cl6col]|uniref:methyltransferase domain-containing protein n=1 Tax=Paenibacillus sp. cl6col TaxID=1761878 RepID=UPI00088B69B7|nr:methyltransferase domain-containing protein [Paenibacillus sp. cl6col]SDF36754.1 malonyl-acyl carrier protein O-methyltransferase BioC [Paenibacillus sp. cl6col]